MRSTPPFPQITSELAVPVITSLPEVPEMVHFFITEIEGDESLATGVVTVKGLSTSATGVETVNGLSTSGKLIAGEVRDHVFEPTMKRITADFRVAPIDVNEVAKTVTFCFNLKGQRVQLGVDFSAVQVFEPAVTLVLITLSPRLRPSTLKRTVSTC